MWIVKLDSKWIVKLLRRIVFKKGMAFKLITIDEFFSYYSFCAFKKTYLGTNSLSSMKIRGHHLIERCTFSLTKQFEALEYSNK